MNQSSQNPAQRPSLFARRVREGTSTAGVALIIVLCMLVLAATLVIAFLSSVSTELRSAKSYAVGLDAKALSDSAVNIVTSQIQDATSAATNAWASQPGMIRTYDTTGKVLTYYKLYSADVLRPTSFSPTAGTSVSTDVPVNWATLPDQYTDLNRPVTNSGITHYPIIDPGAVAKSQSSTTAMDNTSSPIQGCYLDTANTATSTSSTQGNPVPMPVKWLYVLQDGTICSITSTGSITATSSSGGSITPTKTNPVVGRIAFWADDESCKVNINTSGEGTFYGRPWTESAKPSGTYTGYERNFLGFTLPAQNETQRYPGHPAMTSLSVIFPPQDGETTSAYNERIYGIIPRLATGGSQSGTSAVITSTGSMVPNTYRLFSSVDEFMFSATGTTTPRVANLKSPTTFFAQADIEKTRFFLTANSRAPEVNMFNKPRITLWPFQANTVSGGIVTAAPNCWTSKDKLIAFCSTIGNTPYYFQRYNSFDVTTVRTNPTATTYPASLSQNPIPSSQSPSDDWTKIPRNQTLFAYLQYLCSHPIPGLGGTLSGSGGKYTTPVCNQILTEMMDFIRSEISTGSTGTTPTYYYAPSQASGVMVTGEHQVVPLVITPPGASYQTKGFGRFETIQQAAIVFYRLDPGSLNGNAASGYNLIQQTTLSAAPYTLSTAPADATHNINVGAVLILNPFNATPGSRPWNENMRVQVTLTPGSSGPPFNTTSGMLINGVPFNGAAAYNIPAAGFFSTSPYTSSVLLTGLDDWVNATALMGPEFFWFYNRGHKNLGATTVGSPTEENFYPFYGAFTLTGNTGFFQFTPPSGITIKIYSGYDNGTSGNPSPGSLVQTIKMAFPSGTISLPVPTVTLSQSGTVGTFAVTANNSNLTNYYNRLGWLDAANGVSTHHSPSGFVVSGDTVRSVETRFGGSTSPYNLPRGDLRLVAGLTSVPNAYFDTYGAVGSDDVPAGSTAAGYYGSSAAMVHSLQMYANTGVDFLNNTGRYSGYTGSYGSLIGPAGTGYYYNTNPGRNVVTPCVPRGLSSTQVVLTGIDGNLYPGDWDTGPGDQPDGPYINKPDESNCATQLGAAGDKPIPWSGPNKFGDGGPYTAGSDEYASTSNPDEPGNTYSPNRLISSAVAFGSLPTGIDPTGTLTVGAGAQSNGGMRPWQTLLFCANPASEAGNATSTTRHPGFGSNASGGTTAPPYTTPPDHAFLDFFTMPVVEPYAISEPFSTAGKINMNYQIVPFTYLTRDTAVRAVLKSVRMMAIPTGDGGSGLQASTSYKVENGVSLGPPDYRYTLNPDEVSGTLAGFQTRFSGGDIFRSASEICNIYLVPQYLATCPIAGGGEVIGTTSTGATYSGMNSWWSSYKLTGDNVREEPYGYIYPRLTTKSNTFTVHVIAQTLQKAATSAVGQWVSGQDQVSSEYRGSVIIQRYLDPNSDSLISTDGSTPSETNPNSMVGPYKYRVVGTKRFAP